VNLKIFLIPTALLSATCLTTFAQATPPAASVQQPKTFEANISFSAKLKYLLSLPTGYKKSSETWPLVIFLHGSGESGDDLNKVKVHGPPKLVETKGAFPFILVSPQSPGRGWNPDVLNGLVDAVIKEYRVDKDRVYLTGLSMGGYGTWTNPKFYEWLLAQKRSKRLPVQWSQTQAELSSMNSFR
jgi:predicted peptidase